MPLYMYQCAYTSDSLAAQMKSPTDRLEVVGKQLEASGGRIIGGGYSFGEYDVVALIEAPDDTTMASFAIAIGARGAVRAAQTTRLLSGSEWVSALGKANSVGYQPAR
jgi:uncharacterized protein with GYD domain